MDCRPDTLLHRLEVVVSSVAFLEFDVTVLVVIDVHSDFLGLLQLSNSHEFEFLGCKFIDRESFALFVSGFFFVNWLNTDASPLLIKVVALFANVLELLFNIASQVFLSFLVQLLQLFEVVALTVIWVYSFTPSHF